MTLRLNVRPKEMGFVDMVRRWCSTGKLWRSIVAVAIAAAVSTLAALCFLTAVAGAASAILRKVFGAIGK